MKVCFSNKKYPLKIKTHQTQIVNSKFLGDKTGFNRKLKIIGVQNQLPTTFRTAFIYVKISKDRNPTHHTQISNLLIISYYTSKQPQK